MEELNVTSKACFDHAANYRRGQKGGLLFGQSGEGHRFPDEKPRILKSMEEGKEAGAIDPDFFQGLS